LEGVRTVGEDANTRRHFIAAPTFEPQIVQVLENYLMFYKAIDAGLPLYIFLSFCGMSQCYFRPSTQPYSFVADDMGPLGTDIVALPEATIDTDPPDIPGAMRSTFNTFWNGFGYARSDKYNNKGEWIGG